MCSILVANNGLAAVKFISYLRRWANSSFGHDRVVSTMFSAVSPSLSPQRLRVCNDEAILELL